MASLATERTSVVPTDAPTIAPDALKTPAPAPARLVSLDAYRGFIMIVLAANGLAFREVAKSMPDNQVLQFLAFQTDHVDWTGCTFWDLIQPSFMFMVGVAVPFSMARRVLKGDRGPKVWAHIVWRSLVLILLGVFLSTNVTPSAQVPNPRTHWTFVNVLTQIGLGYPFLCLLAGRGFKVQLGAVVLILGGYWLWFYLTPTPDAGFNYKTVGWSNEKAMEGLFAHWNKNTNAAADVDYRFLSQFPSPDGGAPFKFNSGGYQTLNFIPSLATMILGLMAGEMLRGARRNAEKLILLLAASILCLGVGYLAGKTVCPLVKRIWTPSWAVYCAGWTFAMLAFFFAVIDVAGRKRWAFPLVIVGMNSIAMYLMGQLLAGWTGREWKAHLSSLAAMLPSGNHVAEALASPWWPVTQASLVVVTFWLVCLWMYRRGIFLRV